MFIDESVVQYQRPDPCSSFTRSLLQLDRKLTGEGAHLAIIDYGFHEEALQRGRQLRFTFHDHLGQVEPHKGEEIMRQREHGTSAAAIAAGLDVAGIHDKTGYRFEGVAYKANIQCYSLECKDITYQLQQIKAYNEKEANKKCREECETNDCEDCKRKRKMIDVVSISQLADQSQSLDEVLNEIAKQGTLIFAGVGNDSVRQKPGYPAIHPAVIGVGSLERDCTISGFTSKGNDSSSDVYTYGNVLAINGNKIKTSESGKPMAPIFEVVECRGTSFATPAVAGLACLAIQCAKKEFVNIDRTHWRAIIFSFLKNSEVKITVARRDFIAPIKKKFGEYLANKHIADLTI